MSVCTFKESSPNYPLWLSTVKGFPNTVIMAHSNSIYQQAKAITASMDFDYWLYALMTSNLSSAHYFTQLEGRKSPSIAKDSLLLVPFLCLSKYFLLTSNVMLNCMGAVRAHEWGECACVFWLTRANLTREPPCYCPEKNKESRVSLDIMWQLKHLTVKDRVWQQTQKEGDAVPCWTCRDRPLNTDLVFVDISVKQTPACLGKSY